MCECEPHRSHRVEMKGGQYSPVISRMCDQAPTLLNFDANFASAGNGHTLEFTYVGPCP